ncbi:uncharacterized protein LOC103714195 [Phoenix dactylifera]|uniref:Uncharacterized protein LOC103714195 n=1 Tax=Phoenix dactylifera TaxID=42345 RepID=A0A8B8J8B5_PHODC|nr:uncharacterized protein LOC103714195 [Phoenix dactylifera]XP_038981383.1 uncharacterized protein LOC103714195 [Phoenix dactylifera]
MAAKPLTTEAIALTEKKMDMALDDIIKMSKTNKSKGKRPPRQSIKSRGFQNGNASQGSTKARRFMDSRSSIRQGVLAQRRSNFHGNQFPVTTEIARKAAIMPIRKRGVNWNRQRVAVATVQRKSADGSFAGKNKVVSKQRPQTLDALFANMKEQRMMAMSQQTMNGNGSQTAPRHRAQRRGRGGAPPGDTGRRFGNYVK